jgi:predicted Zn-ribbon and HTH transcriptional regulator
MARRADEDFGKVERAFRTVVPSYKGNIRSKMRKLHFKLNPDLGRAIMELSIDPTVRCLSCGWKYSIQKTDQCPICKSDRTRVLDSEDPYSNPVSIFLYPLLGFLFWAIFLISVRRK